MESLIIKTLCRKTRQIKMILHCIQLVLFFTLYQGAAVQNVTITRHPDTPNITVAPGDMAVVGYSITYPAQCTDVHLQLEYSASGRSRKVDDTYCSHSDLYNANVGAASDCPSTDGLKTDWYVLRINGTEDIDGQMVKCVLLKNNLDEVDPNCNSTCEELAIIVTNDITDNTIEDDSTIGDINITESTIGDINIISNDVIGDVNIIIGDILITENTDGDVNIAIGDILIAGNTNGDVNITIGDAGITNGDVNIIDNTGANCDCGNKNAGSTATEERTATHDIMQPTTAQPTTAQPTAAQPTTSQPTTAQPTTAQPTTSQPTTAQPTTSEPTTSQPTTLQPTTSQPTTSQPTTSQPTTSQETWEPTVAAAGSTLPTATDFTTISITGVLLFLQLSILFILLWILCTIRGMLQKFEHNFVTYTNSIHDPRT